MKEMMIKNRPAHTPLSNGHLEGLISSASGLTLAAANKAKSALSFGCSLLNSKPPIWITILLIAAVQFGSTYGNMMLDFKPWDLNANFKFGTELSSYKNSLFYFLEEEISHKEMDYQAKKISVFTLNYHICHIRHI